MSENFTEPEEKDEIIIEPDYNPLSQPINEKPYSKPNVTINPKDLEGEISEPDFIAPPMSMEEPEKNNDKVKEEPKVKRDSAGSKPQPKQYEAFNQDMNELSKKDARAATKYAANMIMQGYEMLHYFGNKAMAFPKKKIDKLVQQGELDLSIQLPYDESGDTISIAEFIAESDEQNSQLLTVSQEFKDEAMPLLIKILEKRKIGLTDEQMLGFLFAKDLSIKGIQVFAIKSMHKDMISTWKEMSSNKSGQNQKNTKTERQSREEVKPTTSQSYNEPSAYAQNQSNKFEEEFDEDNFDAADEDVINSFDDVPSVNEEVNKISGGEVKKDIQKAVVITENNSRRGKGRPRKIN